MHDETAMFINESHRQDVSTAMHQRPVVSGAARRSWRAPEMEEVDYTETQLAGPFTIGADGGFYS